MGNHKSKTPVSDHCTLTPLELYGYEYSGQLKHVGNIEFNIEGFGLF